MTPSHTSSRVSPTITHQPSPIPVDLFSCDCECGCAAKIPAGRLRDILKNVDLPSSPNLLVGPETLDDAGVYELSDGQCLVQTVDYFPPVARDPYMYGQIAAANSLSDVYAMGGRPLTALAIVCFPAKTFGPEVLEEITRGAVDKLKEAGALLLGGHSVVDPQPKYGLAVTGVVDKKSIMDNAHARPGDVLVLTKPLGTGITIMAVKGGMASVDQENAANQCMATLNREAARIAAECGVVACTDITGFGFLGHAAQMAEASGVGMEIYADQVLKLDNVLEFAAMGLLSAATYSNRSYVGDRVEFGPGIEQAEEDLLFDPQTSGGLLVACPPESVMEFMHGIRAESPTIGIPIGKVVDRRSGSGQTPVILVQRRKQ
jgi:selenide,water dikinase